jgi:hypothetical protein
MLGGNFMNGWVGRAVALRLGWGERRRVREPSFVYGREESETAPCRWWCMEGGKTEGEILILSAPQRHRSPQTQPEVPAQNNSMSRGDGWVYSLHGGDVEQHR